MKKKDGISLIVLVITIIVMIILATTIIVSISNNNVVNQAKDAVDQTNYKQIQELAQTVWAEAYINGLRGDNLKNDVLGKLEEYNDKYDFVITDHGVTVTQKGDKQLNEYGFYYDTVYNYVEPGLETDYYVLVLKREGKAEWYYYYPENGLNYVYSGVDYVTYEKDKILFEDWELNVSENGKTLLDPEYSEAKYVYTDLEYRDVYYNEKYYFENGMGYIILQSDNSAKIYDIYDELLSTIPSEGIVKTSHQLTSAGEPLFVSMNGKILTDDNGIVARIRPKYIANHSGTIPEGGVYTKVNGTLLREGDKFPVPETGDVYTYSDYEYMYNGYFDGESRTRAMPMPSWKIDDTQNGWGVIAKDKNKVIYEDLIETICDKSIISLSYTYYNCDNLICPATNIHKLMNVKYMNEMFYTCESLVTLPENFTISDNVITTRLMFRDCPNLSSLPDGFKIGKNVDDVSYMFDGCTVLSGTLAIDANPEGYSYCLSGTKITAITGETILKNEILATK